MTAFHQATDNLPACFINNYLLSILHESAYLPRYRLILGFSFFSLYRTNTFSSSFLLMVFQYSESTHVLILRRLAVDCTWSESYTSKIGCRLHLVRKLGIQNSVTKINENSMMSSAFNAHVTETHLLEGKNPDQLTRIGFSDNETGPSSSNHEDPFMWLDDYKCLLCGVEFPPSFAEERREHSDFHLVEKLQEEEESGDNYKKLQVFAIWSKGLFFIILKFI